jgi:hypothetical protein
MTGARNGRARMTDKEQAIEMLDRQIRVQKSVNEGYIFLKMPIAEKILELLREGKDDAK